MKTLPNVYIEQAQQKAVNSELLIIETEHAGDIREMLKSERFQDINAQAALLNVLDLFRRKITDRKRIYESI